MNKQHRLLILLTTILSACQSNTPSAPAGERGAIRMADLQERIETLSSDEFMGRKPFTEGETKTLAYLEAQYREIGLEPASGDGYLQKVPLVEITTTADSVMTVTGAGEPVKLNGREDYVIWTKNPEGVTLDADELVFAGYGIVAPEYNWNDYKDLDVKDKVVMVLVNDPGFGFGDSTFFKGNEMTYYGRWTYKFEEAARQGAKGCLVIHDDVPASYGFWVVQNSWNTPKLYLDSRDATEPLCAVEGWISLPATKKLLDLAGHDYPKLLAAAHRANFTGMNLGLSVTTALPVKAKYNISYNIAGKITGTQRPEEYVLYSAHWDHLGVGTADATGDSIYNGALDNASGTAGMLEIAEAFAAQNPAPERTVVFLAVTAEEQGLLGSEYYASNPIFPKEATVANINMDGINPYGKMKDIALVGMGQSELDEYLKDEAGKVDRYVSPDPLPAAGYYFRSDHFNFARIGIPALYTHTGIDHAKNGVEYGRAFSEEYVSKYYHKPADEFDPERWSLEGAVDDLQLLYRVGQRLAGERNWPQWKPGSEFKAIRESYRPVTAGSQP